MYYIPNPNYSYWSYTTPARPTEKDFDLEIVSQHPTCAGRKLRKFALDNIDTVGAWEEPFEIHFTNRSNETVQVRISVDGVDVMSAKLADLEVNHSMWVVRAGKTLHLKAFHESQE